MISVVLVCSSYVNVLEHPALAEQPVLAVEIFVTRRAGGDYLVRVSADEEPGWKTFTAADLSGALDAAVRSVVDEHQPRG